MAATSEVQSAEASANGETKANDAAEPTGTTESNDVSPAPTEAIFYGALDRFAQFFVKPLFLESSLEREMQSVNSENNGNLQSDRWRLSKLTGSLCNPEHPINRFTTGNLKTLYEDPIAKGIDVRQRFIDFYEQNYSANRMKLVVLGRESLDELQSWVVELFSGIENKNLMENRWDNVPLVGEDGEYLTVYAKPIKDSRKLTLMFPYPDEDELYDTDPGHYISHLLGHEGEGSLLSYLKKNGWADDLSCGSYTTCPGSGTFTVSVALTEVGLKKTEEIVEATFQYIGLLNEVPPQEEVFHELQSTGQLSFRFKQQEEPYEFTRDLADSMQLGFPRERIISTSYLMRRFDPAAIKEGLTYLRPDNARITITSQHSGKEWTHKEKWYGTEYTTEKWSPSFRKVLETAVASTSATRPKELHLPRPNEFIPTRLEVMKKDILVPAKEPKLLRRDDHLRLWYKKDDQYWVPKAQITVILHSPIPTVDSHHSVIGDIFTALVDDSLTEYAYEANLAGLYHKLSNGYDSLILQLSGFNDKILVLLEKVLDTVRNGTYNEQRFRDILEASIRHAKNTRFADLHMQPRQFRSYLTTDRTYLSEQRVEALEKLTMEDIKSFIPELLRAVRIEILAVGNLTKEDARKAASLCETILKPQGLPQGRLPTQRVVILPPGSNYVYQRPVDDPENINNCLEQCIWTGSNEDFASAATSRLTAAILKEPFYDQLRTAEQLGYVVQSGYGTPWPNSNHFILLRVQSVRPVDYLESRIEVFLTRLGDFIRDLDDSKFEKHKAGLCNQILEKPKTIYEESDEFLGALYSGDYHFEKGTFHSTILW
jgi:insulysin